MTTAYQRLVERIQELLYSSTTLSRTAVQPIADEYRETCQAINERLRDVGGLLRQGLRSEAIHRSNVEPNLLDVVAVLDFPEVPQWHDLLTRLKINRPPGLLIDVAGELNEAYAEEKPLENLLRRHRLFAIGRAPLHARIHTLRKIQQLDAKNPVWRLDLKEYEAVRQAELKDEFDTVVGRKDLAAATTLRTEIAQSPWLVPPPSSLLSYVDGCLAQLQREAARQKLSPLAARLEQAMEALDTEEVEQLLPHWQALVQHARPPGNDADVMRVQRVQAWLESEANAKQEHEEQEFAKKKLEQQLEDFKAAVKGNVKPDSLVRRREELKRQKVPVPKFLESQYEERLKKHRTGRTVKTALIGLAVLLGLAGAAVAVWFLTK